MRRHRTGISIEAWTVLVGVGFVLAAVAYVLVAQGWG